MGNDGGSLVDLTLDGTQTAAEQGAIRFEPEPVPGPASLALLAAPLLARDAASAAGCLGKYPGLLSKITGRIRRSNVVSFASWSRQTP